MLPGEIEPFGNGHAFSKNEDGNWPLAVRPLSAVPATIAPDTVAYRMGRLDLAIAGRQIPTRVDGAGDALVSEALGVRPGRIPFSR